MEKNEAQSVSEYSIFKPKSARGIKLDYPELKQYAVFNALNNDQMLFVWYYACESSPFFKMARDRDRVQEALNHSLLRASNSSLNKTEKEEFLSGNFPAKITSAIEEMQRFKVGPRIRAKQMIEKGFENIEKILNVDASESSQFLNKDGEIDFAKKKSFVDTLAKAMDIMPGLIKQLEGNFSLKEDKKEEDAESAFEGRSLIDEFHEK
jgi:hypothetical protein